MVNDLIYDIGMHNGNDTAFYLACGFRVLAVEADPGLAVAEQAGTAEFWINEVNSTLNSFNRNSTTRFGEPHHPIMVKCRRLDEIVTEYGVPFYMKIDIEGNDLLCCNQLSTGSKPKYISVEMSQIELLLKLRDLGYDRFKLITQVDHQAIGPQDTKLHVHFLRSIYRLANYHKENRKFYLRVVRGGAAAILQLAVWLGIWGTKPFRSRRLPEWNFGEGSTCSGTFGEDLPGEWLTWEGIAYLWHRDLREYQKMRVDLFCDLHACISTEKT